AVATMPIRAAADQYHRRMRCLRLGDSASTESVSLTLTPIVPIRWRLSNTFSSVRGQPGRLSACIFSSPTLQAPTLQTRMSARTRKAGQAMVHALTRRGGGIRRLVAPALLLALSGCALFDRPDPRRPDPLTGLPKRIPANDRPVSSTYNPAEQTRAGIVATSGQRPGEGTSGLTIRDNSKADSDRGTQPAGAWTGKESRTSSAPGDAARTTSTAPAGDGMRVRTFEEAQQFLGARGVKWQELKNTGENEWAF